MRSYPLHYLATLPLEASSTMLDVRELAHPFDYELEVPTEEGPEVRKVHLIETFNLLTAGGSGRCGDGSTKPTMAARIAW
jgi:hypothetical protein